ncbi:MAG TPA: DUF882 domain-containing protein [Microvirga sp.]
MSVLRKGRPSAGPCAASFFVARRAAIGTVAALALLIGTQGTQDAIANGDTRSLRLYHNHTKESLTVTFRRNGQYDPRALEQLNWFLRDWRRDEPTRMDPRLFDTLWEVYREVGSSEPIHVNSAYRSPNTNAMLRRRSGAVAKNSQHMRGKAMDFYLPDVPMERVRAIGMRLQDGGVGYYPSAYTPFVHLDVGSVRAWPRMTRDQLARIFPDGKTVHIPADGEPLPRYEEAKAEILAKGGTVGGYTAVAEAEETTASTTRRKGFWATLFGGGGDEDEDAEEVRTVRGRQVYVARRAPPPNIYGDRDSVYAALQPQQPAPVTVRAARPAPLPEPEPATRVAMAAALQKPMEEPEPPRVPPTRIAGLPTTVETPTGPRLSWQQGPNGSQSPAGQEIALAPLPPRRPDEVVTTGALAFAPMPPARPGSLAASEPLVAAGAPELRTLTAAAVTEGVDHPLPPPRPGARPLAVAVASAEPLPLPAAKPPLAAAAPAPITVAAASAPAVKSVAKDAPRDERAQLRDLFSAAATFGGPATSGFSQKPLGDLATNRFTGPAVKPVLR